MTRLSILSLVLTLALGCAPSTVTPKPVPQAVTLEDAAAKSIDEYRIGLADAARDTAKDLRDGKYKAQSQVFDAYKERTKNAREFLTAYEKRFNQEVPPNTALDAERTAKAFDAVERGFRK